MNIQQNSKISFIQKKPKKHCISERRSMLDEGLLPSVARNAISERNSIMICDSSSDGQVVLKAADIVYHDNEKGRVVSEIVLDGIVEKTPAFSKVIVNIISHVAQIDLSKGVYFILKHDADCNLSISNIPSAGKLCTISVLRIKDDSNVARNIKFGDEFINAPSGLTQKPLARDLLSMRTIDGGITWIVGTINDLVAV